ncbi:hypothetical protein [Pararhodobacter oceanensis]|uniref:hypothetical protein n=1 Tax=Pararhodobacter oceanensis TaxID=2172121 RepID=UPI003A911B25
MEWLSSFWCSHGAKLALSIFCIVIALFDTFGTALSPIAAGALAVAIVPWVVGIVEKITAPGGLEIVFSKVEQKLDSSNVTPDEEDLNAFKYFESNDPNLAIALLRVQVERRLRQIAEDVGLGPTVRGRPLSLRSLAQELSKQGAISEEAMNLLMDLIPAMNEAVHGIALQSTASEFALSYGPKILSTLKIRH